MVSAQIEKSSRNSGNHYSVQYTDIKKNNKYHKKKRIFMPSLIKRGFHTWEPIAHTAIEKSIEAGSSLLVLSTALPVQVRAATFGTFLFPPTVNLVEGSGTHTASNADLSLLLELHSLQAETAADTNADHFNQLRRGEGNVEG